MSRHTFEDLSLLRACANVPAASSVALSHAVDLSGWPGAAWGDLLTGVDIAALNGTQLPDGATITFSFLMLATNLLGSEVTSTTVLGTVTGAGGVGSLATTFAKRMPTSGGGRYGCLEITTSAGVNAAGTPQTLFFALSY